MDMEQASPPVRYQENGDPLEMRYALLTLAATQDAIRSAHWIGRRIHNMGEVRLTEQEAKDGSDPIAAAVVVAVYSDGLCVLLNHIDADDFVEQTPLVTRVYGWDQATFAAFGAGFPELDKPTPSEITFDGRPVEYPRVEDKPSVMVAGGMLLHTHKGPVTVAILDRLLTAAGWVMVESWGGDGVICTIDPEAGERTFYGMVIRSLLVRGHDIIDWHKWSGDKFPTRIAYDAWVQEHKSSIYRREPGEDKGAGPITGVNSGGPQTDMDANR